MTIHVTVWNEYFAERSDPAVRATYPQGLHAQIAAGISRLEPDALVVRTASLDEPGQGLPPEVLDSTDVLFWWDHERRHLVDDNLVERIVDRVRRGMGLVALHSAHFSKVFRALMGTSCRLRWRNGNDRELVWAVSPTHPVARGVPFPLVIPAQEMYGEFFDIPVPDELVFVSSFSGGEVFRSGCGFFRGQGRIFYFSPGDQGYPVYHNEGVLRVLANAALWAAPAAGIFERPYAPEYSAHDWFIGNPAGGYERG